MNKFIAPLMLGGFLVMAPFAFAAEDNEARDQAAETTQSRDMTPKEAYQNVKKDAATVGDKAVEAYDASKKAASEAWEKTKKAFSD